MTILETLKGRTASKSPLPAPNRVAEVAAKLEIAEAEFTDLEARYGQAALDAVIGNGDVGPLSRQLNAARDQVATLRAAHKAALDREQQEIQRQRAQLQKTQLVAVKKSLVIRDDAAIGLAKAIADCAKHYRELQNCSAKARAATPIGMRFPGGADFEFDTIKNLVAAELWKASAKPGDSDGLAFPGARYPHTNFQHDPTGITPLAETIKKGSDFVLGKLTVNTSE